MSFAELASVIGGTAGARLQPGPATRVSGGNCSKCYRWESDAGPLFVKLTEPTVAGFEMLQAESQGLTELRQANSVRTPAVLGVGESGGQPWLALEWIESGARSSGTHRMLGTQLAIQHRCTASAWGWRRDNTIGATPQLNGWMQDWVEFWRERRLRPQLQLAARNGHGGGLQQRADSLLACLGDFFSGYEPAPSLLHGDLWGGNWTADLSGAPVIFDPAVYYGDREADLAMTHLFGGFGSEFYAAYRREWPLDSGAAVRTRLYNLYHVLNHLNLFGAGYYRQALAMTDQLLAQLGH